MEFREVMKQKKRMCEKHTGGGICQSIDYDICPLKGHELCSKPIILINIDKIQEGEEIIVRWADEHPVEYPYMIDVLYDVFNMPKGLNVSNAGIWEWLNTIRISEEMAVKLGIEPKEDAR